MPERELPPPPRRPRGAAPAVPPASGLSGLPAHLARPKTLEELKTGLSERWAQYAVDDAQEAQAAQASQHTQARAQADQAVRDQSLETQGFRPSGFAGALDTAGQALGAAGHGIAQAFNTTVAGARTIGLGAMSALANGPDAAPGYARIAPPVDFNSGTNQEITQRFIDDAQGHGESIAATPSPTAWLVGHTAEIGANVGLGIANPALAGASAAGSASNAGYSDAGAGAIGVISALPIVGKGLGALAGRVLPRVLRSPGVENAVGQGMIGGVTPGLINAGTQMFESPELAAQTQANLGQDTLLSGGMGLGLGALESMVTRGRGAFVPPPRSRQAPSSAAVAPESATPVTSVRPGAMDTELAATPVGFERFADRAATPGQRVGVPATPDGDAAFFGGDGDAAPAAPAQAEPAPGVFRMVRPPLYPQTPDSQLRFPDPTGLRGLPKAAPGGYADGKVDLKNRAPGELPGRSGMDELALPIVPEALPARDPVPPHEPYDIAPYSAPEMAPENSPMRQPNVVGPAGRPLAKPVELTPEEGAMPGSDHPPGFDTDARTRTGSDLSPVEVPPSWELPGRFNRRPGKTQANDPFGENLDERANAPSEVDLTPVEPTRPDPFAEYNDEPEKLGAMGRMDKSLPDTELQLDPVAQRAEQATDRVAPVRENVRPEYGSDTTRMDLPITPAKPGLRHLSPEAQDWVMSDLKPGERELLRGAIAERGKQNDQAGDKGNLQQELIFLRAKRDKKPGARPKTVAPDEGAVPRPTSSRAEADLVQGGFRRQGEPTPKPVDTEAPTERIAKPVAPGVPGTHTLYHGTSRAGFTDFDPYGGEYGLMGDGTYFTDSQSMGREYMTKGKGGSPGLYEAKVTVKNPLDMDAPANPEAWAKALAKDSLLSPEPGAEASWRRDLAQAKTNEEAFRIVEREIESMEIPRSEGREMVQSLVREMGHDSVTHIGGGRHAASKGEKHRVYIALDPEQVTGARQIEGGAGAPAEPTTPGRFGLRPPDNSRQGSLNVSDPLEALGKGIAKVASVAAKPTIGAAKIAVATAKAIDKPYSKPLVDVVRDMPGGKAAAEKADKVLSYGKELVGKFSVRALAATKAITKGPRAKAARASLDEVDYRGSLGFARIHEVLDGAIPSRPAEEPFRKEMHGLTYGTGLTAERDGYTINVGNKPLPFKADPARQRAPRIGLPGLRYYAQRPDHPDTIALVKDIAAEPRNAGLKPEDIFGEFKAWAERGITKRGMAEDARTIKAFPTHWRAPDGRIVQLLETDPHKLIQAVAQTFPERIAFRKHFGGEAVPKEFGDLQRVSGDKGATAGENLFRTLHRMRLHDGVSDLADDVLPGSAAEATRDWLNYPYQAIKEGKLSMAALPNLFETLGKTRAIGGNANYAKAFKDIVLTSSAKREAVLTELAQRGAITRDVLDWYVNKSNYAETVTRFTRNTLSAARHSVDELNERVSARTMQLWSEGLQKGKGGLLDRPKLAQMNYSPDQIDAIIKGGFSDRVQADLMRRANVSAQQLRAHPAERSRLGNSPAWTNFTIGDQYAQANQNRNLRLWGEVAKAAMTPSLSHAERVKATTAALGHAVNSAGGQLAASSLTMIARAMIYGGGAVLLDKASGSPLGLEDFMQDAFKYAFIGGPAQAVVNTLSAENGKVTDDIVRPFLPISVLQEARDLVYSTGKYDGMGGIEGVGTFLASNLAATPMIANIVAVAGLAKDDKALDAGITAFRNWKAEYAPEARITPVASPDAFRAAMRQAGEALKDGVDPSEAIYKALGSRKRDSVADSLRGRKILPPANTPAGKAERAEALKYLGPATMHKLEMYDRMLEVWAKRVNPPE